MADPAHQRPSPGKSAQQGEDDAQPANGPASPGPPDEARIQVLYRQLRAAAQQQLAAERPGHTLQATALVHEAYMRLAQPRAMPWKNDAHFYVAAVEAMRRVLLDHARARNCLKRGGGQVHQALDAPAEIPAGNSQDSTDFVAIDQAISRLMERDRRAAEIVRLRFYAGLSTDQIAQILGVSERTVTNDWTFAKSWLTRELRTEPQ